MKNQLPRTNKDPGKLDPTVPSHSVEGRETPTQPVAFPAWQSVFVLVVLQRLSGVLAANQLAGGVTSGLHACRAHGSEIDRWTDV